MQTCFGNAELVCHHPRNLRICNWGENKHWFCTLSERFGMSVKSVLKLPIMEQKPIWLQVSQGMLGCKQQPQLSGYCNESWACRYDSDTKIQSITVRHSWFLRPKERQAWVPQYSHFNHLLWLRGGTSRVHIIRPKYYQSTTWKSSVAFVTQHKFGSSTGTTRPSILHMWLGLSWTIIITLVC